MKMHDVVFATGMNNLEIIEKIKQKWIGTPSFYVDSYVILNNIEGYEVEISTNKSPSEQKLYFVNLDSY